MIRKLFGLVLVSVVVKSSFAIEIHKGRLVDHQEWVSGSVKLQVKNKPHKAKNNLIKLLLERSRHENSVGGVDGILLTNKVSEADGVVGTETEIGGHIAAYVQNFTSIAQTYKIRTAFCLVNAEIEPGENCAYKTYNVVVEPAGYAVLDTAHTLAHNFETTGHYKALLITIVTRENLSTYFATAAENFVSIASKPEV